MSDVEPVSRWLVLVIRLPAQPSRHRVGVWRELRRIGARSLGRGIRAVPDVPVEEEEQSLERPGRCVAVCEDYAERVLAAPHQAPETQR